MKRRKLRLNNSSLLCLLVGLCLVLVPSTGQCFYNPNSGKWLSRDPIGEKGGKNLFVFVSNRPQGTTDALGLAGWVYTEVPPSGVWAVRVVDIDNPNFGTLHGFRSRYVMSIDPACPCKKENIIVVQAVRERIYGTQMDNVKAVYAAYHHQKGTPFRDYYDMGPGWALAMRQDPLEIWDTPLLEESQKVAYTWHFEDCAVCRRMLKDGTVYDRVLGCIAFDFVRYWDGTVDLGPGKKAIFQMARSPGPLWEKALKNWKDWTDN